MARRRRQPSQSPPHSEPEASAPGADGLSLTDITGLALIALRWFTPTEGTFRGDTLWISQLWLGWGILAAWSAMRNHDRWTRRTGPWSWGLLALTAGHIVSGLAVVFTDGQKRAALNGLWEWVSLGLAAIWFHHRASSPRFRRTFRLTLIAASIGLSALGIWQRWVAQPALGRAVVEFDDLEARLPSLEGQERRQTEARLLKLRETVGPEYTSLDDAGRRSMRQRLLESTEPLGRFALANSLAAILLVGMILLAGEIIPATPFWHASPDPATPADRRSPKLFGPSVALLILIAFVFLLTKSRTALTGAAVGGILAFILGSRGRWRTALYWGFLTTGAAAILMLITWAAGGLDRLVVSEAPKSLEYRTEYWIGTWRVIQRHPLLGVGSGNFRQHYLSEKLAKSSEEILDPHQFILEAWVTGGLLALAGLLTIIILALREGLRGIDPVQEAGANSWRTSAPAILTTAITMLFLQEWLLEGFADGELAAVGGATLLAAIALNRLTRPAEASGSTELASRAAWFALSIHLLGAGGMEMPAIIQLWLCLSSLVVAPAASAMIRTAGQAMRWPASISGLALLGCGLAFFGQLATATIPSMTSRAETSLADAEAARGARAERSDALLANAAAADRFDPEPWRRRAQFAFRQWSQTRSEEAFEKAIEYQQEAIRRDPVHAHDHRALANLYLQRFEIDHRSQDADAAVQAMQRSLELYPNQLTGRRTLAEALHAAGKTSQAKTAAQAALELDALWTRLGHFDKTLTPAERDRMKALAGED